MPSKDIVGWDDPFSDEGVWVVPAESEAAAAFVWTTGIESTAIRTYPLLTKQLRTRLSLRAILIGCS
jgi:hypothetical protein